MEFKDNYECVGKFCEQPVTDWCILVGISVLLLDYRRCVVDFFNHLGKFYVLAEIFFLGE